MKTVTNEEFHRERRRAEIEINKPFGDNEKIWFIDTSDDEAIRMGLNCAGTGTMNATEVEKFAEAVKTGMWYIKNFKYNGYKKTY